MKRFGAALRSTSKLMPVMAAMVGLTFASQSPAQYQDVIDELNEHSSVAASEETKNYRILFDAYLQMTPPPMEIGEFFNMTTVHAGMSDWPTVAGWAESNTVMADAILNAVEANTIIVGLPYGVHNVPSNYREAGLYVDVASDGTLRRIRFEYFPALDTIQAYVAAEVYRLLEAGRHSRALDLAIANIVILRQFCDRDFLEEKAKSIHLLSEALVNLRCVMYDYLQELPADYFNRIAFFDMPFLRPDRNRLFMPEADRLVAERLIRDVFDEQSAYADPSKFSRVFAAIQAQDVPLTRFGAARRWEMIAGLHDSLDASLQTLELVYNDWWRRWRVEAYDPILAVDTQYERTNPVRYAAVIFSMRNIDDLFAMRDRLILEVRGTAMAAGICGYIRTLNAQPRNQQALYSQFVRKITDVDPYDMSFGTLTFFQTRDRYSVNTPWGQIWIDPDVAMLWGKGQNNEDDRARQHTNDGIRGDIVVWPPPKALAREQGLLD